MNILINFFASLYDLAIAFFASLYDLVYYSVNFLLKPIMKLTLKIKKTGPLNILIDFFAFQYDVVYDFIFFLKECAIWATNMRPTKSTDFAKQEPIQVDNRTPFDKQ
jgi:hypothetical protein